MPDRRWKAAERRIASALGGERVPVSGRARGDRPDVAHPSLSVEVKTRERLPSWLLDAVAQATAAAKAHQTPVAVLHACGTRYDDALVVVRLRDFLAGWSPGAGSVG